MTEDTRKNDLAEIYVEEENNLFHTEYTFYSHTCQPLVLHTHQGEMALCTSKKLMREYPCGMGHTRSETSIEDGSRERRVRVRDGHFTRLSEEKQNRPFSEIYRSDFQEEFAALSRAER